MKEWKAVLELALEKVHCPRMRQIEHRAGWLEWAKVKTLSLAVIFFYVSAPMAMSDIGSLIVLE